MKENILLVYGGLSVEHEISIITALQVKKKYSGKFNLVLCYFKNGKFYINNSLNDLNTYKNFKAKKFNEVVFKANSLSINKGIKKIKFIGVMLMCHGINCEDGTLYAFFKTLNIPVISENIYSAIIGQDKQISKELANVNIVDYKSFDLNDTNLDYLDISDLSFPVIIKPQRLGSSIGISVANNLEELVKKVKELSNFTNQVIIENKLTNFDEYNIALFKDMNNFIISNVEKVSNNKVLSYNDKYNNDEKSMIGQKREIPAKINENLKNLIIETAKTIYNNLHASLIVRIDFLYDNDTNTLFFNEINNIPGSLALYLFDNKTITTNDLLDKYIIKGLEQYDKENNFINTYEDNIFLNNSFNVNIKK